MLNWRRLSSIGNPKIAWVIASQLLPAVQLDYFAGQSDVDAKGSNGIYTPTTDAYLAGQLIQLFWRD